MGLYLLSYELLVPLRNALMFTPRTVASSVDEWNKISKVFTDCHIEQGTTSAGTGTETVDSVYELIKNSPTIHHPILRFLEEGSADLWCAMTGEMLSESHCPAVWASNDMEEGERSDCWVQAYDGLYGEGAAAAMLVNTPLTPSPSPTPTSAPTPTPTPAPTSTPAPTPAPTSAPTSTPAPTPAPTTSNVPTNQLTKQATDQATTQADQADQATNQLTRQLTNAWCMVPTPPLQKSPRQPPGNSSNPNNITMMNLQLPRMLSK